MSQTVNQLTLFDVFQVYFCNQCDFSAGELKVEKHLALNKIGHGKYLVKYAFDISIIHCYRFVLFFSIPLFSCHFD